MASDMWDEEDDLDDVAAQEAESEGVYERHRYTVDKGQGALRIDKYLALMMGGTSRNRIQDAAAAGWIRVNGKIVKSNYKVKPEDEIVIVTDRPRTECNIEPEDIPIDIVYEDDDLMVVNKAAGMVVHPGVGNWTGTLLNAIAHHLKDDPRYDFNNPEIGLAHRIDKDTSGLIVIAKTPEAKMSLGKQFFDKTTRRLYNAVVWGTPDGTEGTITGDIGRDPRDRQRYAVFGEGETPNAKHAVTHYKVLERLGYVSLVECRLETGRTHQIRVHMKHTGHPLFGDERYGGCEILRGERTAKYKQFVQNALEICPRQALHAKTLGFRHPRTGEEMDFVSEWADDFAQLVEKWRRYASGKEG